jgi:CsbD-like.
MNEQHIKGTAKKAEGAVKDAVGKVTGNEKLQAQGKADKAEGATRQAAGDVKDAGSKVADAFKR